MQDEGQGLFEIRLSELRVHTVDSFAARVQELAEFARQNGFQILDWSVDADWSPETGKRAMGRLTRLRRNWRRPDRGGLLRR